jgi:HSP20 family protein
MTPHDESHGFPSLRREVESIFGEVLGVARPRAGGGGRWSPTLDLTEEPGRYVIEMDIPGVRLEDLSMSVSGRRLVVSGRRELVREREHPSVRVRERWSGAFSRSLDLPDEVDESRISATLREGILRIELPRRGGRR